MITVDDSAVLSELGAMMARLANPTPLLESIGQWQEQKIVGRIEGTKHDPLDALWAAWALRTEHDRTAKGNAEQGLLWDSGALLHSVSFNPSGNSVEIGSSGLGYAPHLQNGTGRMPAREFVGWSPEDMWIASDMARIFVETGYA